MITTITRQRIVYKDPKKEDVVSYAASNGVEFSTFSAAEEYDTKLRLLKEWPSVLLDCRDDLWYVVVSREAFDVLVSHITAIDRIIYETPQNIPFPCLVAVWHESYSVGRNKHGFKFVPLEKLEEALRLMKE